MRRRGRDYLMVLNETFFAFLGNVRNIDMEKMKQEDSFREVERVWGRSTGGRRMRGRKEEILQVPT
jgi:hypothetical protein